VKAALAIAAAEVRALRLALASGVLLGFVGHFLIYRSRVPRALPSMDVAVVLAAVPVLCMQLGLAAVLGVGAVSRDLAERRLGFYLARPVAPLAYWGAKLSAAILVAYLSGWLMLLAGFVIGPAEFHAGAVRAMLGQKGLLLGGVVATAFVAAAAAAAAGAVRSRSGLLPLDIVMLCLTAAALVAVLAWSWEEGTLDVVLLYGRPWLVGVALLLLLAGSAAQVSLGRLDLRRGHLSLSAILWTGLLACLLGLALFSRAVSRVTPEDLRLRAIAPIRVPASGGRVLIEGSDARWRQHGAAFFLDAQGRFIRKPAAWDSGSGWSADGRHFAWLQASFPGFGPLGGAKPLRFLPGLGASLWVIDFDGPGAAPRLVARREPAGERMSALSPSGRRVLISNARFRSKLVVDADDGRTLASIAEPASWSEARFLSETTLRALRMDGRRGRIVEWDTASGRLLERGAIAFEGEPDPLPRRLIPTHDWERVLRLDSAGLFLHDLDGKLVATLIDGWLGRGSRAAGLLSQGRFGSVDLGPQGPRLRVFDRDGQRQLETRVEGLSVGGETAPGVLVLARGRSWGTSAAGEPWSFPGESAFVDLETGNIVRRERGIWPAFPAWSAWAGGASVEAGSLATRLFSSDDQLVLLDPASGARKVLVQWSKP
jgi:hypothetical protein